jgi:leader peptidase (prepilin peptidase)/N-methyltransferase
MTRALLVLGSVVLGAVVVGPVLNHAITRWIGWRVVLPPFLGRVPAAGELGRARARCSHCGAGLAPAGLPVLPATAVGWRCGGCRAHLPVWPGAVEAVTGALFGLATAVVGPEISLVPVFALVAGLVAMSAVDLAVMRIPTRFVRVTAGLVAAGLVVATLADGPTRRLLGAAIGAAVYGGLLLVMHLISPRMLGFGDVRLATVVGASVGWFGWRPDYPVLDPVRAVVNAGLLAGLIGSVVGLVLLVVRGRDRPFPFGPAIGAGGLIVVLSLA